ncbi:acyltransferase family protein [Lapillicoccus jejuensis]|uniref:Peptidoglycan/LPS O-acetylase OafA/YrhL n=1 Tax=Lapillicoccus jejuensis TaxID=402171 RepID=A0A542E0N8_9MICO|nr:acyltransferase family protein [Lapillicoccus jejuensis]TQJ08754.1 peptidoglycan/LPS O-acetylase OafA/YrhL [Lapillicoccus jejuensis]
MTTTTLRPQPVRTASSPPPDGPGRAFRPDIEGLRALAVTAVVAYHAHLGVRGGYVGVDVFLVLSGFLITGRLLRDLPDGGLPALGRFYAHRVRRLLPASTLVLVTTLLAARFLGPPLDSDQTAAYGLHAALSVLNRRLATLQVDYLHAGTGALSPLTHYWSLGLEEQFYLGWPLVVLVVARLLRARVRGALLVLLVGLVAWSAWRSAVVTAADAGPAYFWLTTRAWELGVGALLAVALPRLERLPHRLTGPLSVAGLLVVTASCFGLSDRTVFPGTAAWLPVLGTAAVVAAGCDGRAGAEPVLAHPATQWVGRRSYSWYLWHWPLLVLVPVPADGAGALVGRAAVALASLAVAAAAYRFVEQPARAATWSTARWLAFAAGATLVSLVTATAVLVLPPDVTGPGAAATVPSLPRDPVAAATTLSGLARSSLGATSVPVNLTPALRDAADSVPPTTRNGCQAPYLALTQGDCRYGDPSARRTVVLFGDSHAEQWLPALDRLGRDEHWRVVSWTKAACAVADVPVFNETLQRDYTECDTWRAATVARIAALHPDLVIASQSEGNAPPEVSPALFAAATVGTLERLRAAGVPRVAVVGEIPTPGVDVPACLAAHLDDVSACTFERSRALPFPDRHAAVASALARAGIPVLELVPLLCGETRCPVVVGDLLVYRNESHVTVPWSLYLTPVLRPLLDGAAP